MRAVLRNEGFCKLVGATIKNLPLGHFLISSINHKQPAAVFPEPLPAIAAT
jgi:hypothetical protein